MEELLVVQWPEFNEDRDCDSQEKAILESLRKINTKQFDSFLAALRVLKDDHNPERYSHAAHSARELIAVLCEDTINETKFTSAEEKAMVALDKEFNAMLQGMPLSDEKEEKNDVVSFVQRKYDALKRLLLRGKINLKQKLISLYETRHPGYPKEVIEGYSQKLAKCNDYFVGKCVHHRQNDIDSNIFAEKWQEFKDCLASLLHKLVEDDIPKIDPLLAMEQPPKE